MGSSRQSNWKMLQKIGDLPGALESLAARNRRWGSDCLADAAKLFLRYRASVGEKASCHLRALGLPGEWMDRVESVAGEVSRREWNPGNWDWRPGMTWVPIFFEGAGNKASIARLLVSEGDSAWNDPATRDAIESAKHSINHLLAPNDSNFQIVPPESWAVTIRKMTGEALSGDALRGDSLALPLALAMLSLLYGKRLSPSIVSTGSLGEDGLTASVGNLAEKFHATEKQVPGLTLFLHPIGTSFGSRMARPVASLVHAARLVFGKDVTSLPPSLLDWNRIVDDARAAYRRNDSIRVIRYGRWAESIPVPVGYEKARWELSILFAASLAHSGETYEARSQFRVAMRRANSLRRQGRINIIDHVTALNVSQAPLIDMFLFEDVIPFLQNCHKEVTGTIDRVLHGKVCGHLGYAYMSCGKAKEALPYLRDASKLVPPIERARNYCYLGQAYARLGNVKNALKMYRKSVEEATKDLDPKSRHNAFRFSYVHWAHCCVAAGDWQGAREALRKGMQACDSFAAMRGGFRSYYPEILYYRVSHWGAALGGDTSLSDNGGKMAGPVAMEKVLAMGEASKSWPIRLVASVACLDAFEGYTLGTCQASNPYGLLERFLQVVAENRYAKRHFRVELSSMSNVLRGKDNLREIIEAIRSVRRRMPNL